MVPPPLEHDPEKWLPVFGKDHAPAKGYVGIVSRPLLRLSARCALAAALALALGLGACGRKGDLDPPPGRFADPRVTDAPAPAPGPDGQVAATAPNAAPAAPTPARKTTPIDWLLN
jgi:predicted small lipoprotein YifL